jgi:hypothetical protein
MNTVVNPVTVSLAILKLCQVHYSTARFSYFIAISPHFCIFGRFPTSTSCSPDHHSHAATCPSADFMVRSVTTAL